MRQAALPEAFPGLIDTIAITDQDTRPVTNELRKRGFGTVRVQSSSGIPVTVDRRITPPTAASERSMIVSCHAAPQYSDADHAHLPGDTHLVPGFSRRGNVHVRLAD